MDVSHFWEIIEEAKTASKGDLDELIQILIKHLSTLSPAEIIDFKNIYLDLRNLACTNELWDAAYLLKGSCGDDCFSDFRGWLIAQGKSIFYAALKDPEILADIAEVDNVTLSLYKAPWTAYHNKTGEDNMPRRIRKSNTEFERVDFDLEAATARFPKLAIKFEELMNKREEESRLFRLKNSKQ
jgi:hypothetical protein